MTAEELRNRAEAVRTIAGLTMSEGCRRLLLNTAETYERMAEHHGAGNDHKAIQRRSGLSHWVEQQELRQLLDVPA